MDLANEADKDCDFATNISGCFHFVKKKLTSVPKIEMIDYTSPPRPPAARPYVARVRPLSARRSSIVRMITDQLMPFTRTLRGGTIFPVLSTTPSNVLGGSV